MTQHNKPHGNTGRNCGVEMEQGLPHIHTVMFLMRLKLTELGCLKYPLLKTQKNINYTLSDRY